MGRIVLTGAGVFASLGQRRGVQWQLDGFRLFLPPHDGLLAIKVSRWRIGSNNTRHFALCLCAPLTNQHASLGWPCGAGSSSSG